MCSINGPLVRRCVDKEAVQLSRSRCGSDWTDRLTLTTWAAASNIHQWWMSSTHTHTYTRLTALCPVPEKVKPIWILLKQETVSGSGISWAICKSAPRSRQITTPAPHQSVFTGRIPFLPPNQQRQSTEGKLKVLLTYLLADIIISKIS